MEDFQECYLPKVLYRVQYPGRQTRYSPEHGLSARDKTTVPNNAELLGRFVKESFTWGSPTHNPFINLFSERDHAVNWAISESKRAGQGYLVMSIDTSELDKSRTIKLLTVTRKLNIMIPERALSHVRGAYLYLHEIPAQSIYSTETSEGLLKGWVRLIYVIFITLTIV
jgi:hypothetical protein